MTCYSPIHAFEGPVLESGKLSTVWKRVDSPEGVKRDFPCYQCVGCRLSRSRHWAMRCMDESSLYENNCFVTLTFDSKHLPKNRSLDVSVFQKFMKRLRKKYGSGIRFYHCGEYGSLNMRPHYHALLFNHDFSDKQIFTIRNGNNIYRSKDLESLWPFGYSSVGALTFQSAAYVARYVLKKVTGDFVDEHYVNKLSGECLKPEYTTMSRGGRSGEGGIGSRWFSKFSSDVFPEDVKVFDGVKFKPPKFYDNLLAKLDFDLYEVMKARRKDEAVFSDDVRLRVMEQVKLAQISSLKRSLEV